MVLGKLARKITQHLALSACITILLGMAVGEFWRPQGLRYLIPLAVLLVLYPFMFDLEIERIKRSVTRPGLLLTALAINLLVSPLLAFAISTLLFSTTAPWLTVGLVLFGSIPCGGMVPAFTGMLKGNVNLSLTITATSLLLSVVTAPFWSTILLGTFVPVPVWLIARYLFIIILVPFLLAEGSRRILIKKKGKAAFISFKKNVADLSGPGLMLFIFIIFVLNGKAVQKDPSLVPKVMCAVALFGVVLLTVTGMLAKLINAAPHDGTALQIGSSIKNTPMAIAVAVSSFDAEVALVLAIAGPLAQLPTMLTFLHWKKMRVRQKT